MAQHFKGNWHFHMNFQIYFNIYL